jgi:hypothetical protein
MVFYTSHIQSIKEIVTAIERLDEHWDIQINREKFEILRKMDSEKDEIEEMGGMIILKLVNALDLKSPSIKNK